MNDLIQRVINAIFRQEGMDPDYKNPGNLRGAPWLSHPITAKNFWQPTSRTEGVAGAAHVVALHIAQGDSLVMLISHWAPPSENNTVAYIANVKAWANIPNEHAPLHTFING